MSQYKDIYVVPTFHHDIAYLQPERVYTDWADKILTKAIEIMRNNADYCFTVEQAYYFKHFWEQNPDLHDELIKFAKEGRLSFAPGFWSVPDMCMPSGESIYMQATLGKRLLKDTVGVNPRTAFIADCWGHHAQLPQILTQCGYDYYTFSRCMERDFAKENFVWQGLDGSIIKGHWMSTGYAGINFPDRAPQINAEELHWEDASKEGIMKLYERNSACCGDEVQIMPAGGDMKMPSAASPAIVASLNADEDMPSVKFSSLDKAFNSIDFSSKPIYSDEFISSLKGTFSTNIQIKLANRTLEQKLCALEVLSVVKNLPVDLQSGWEAVLKNQFHDIICGTICDEALEQTEKEYEQTKEMLDGILAPSENKGYFNALPFDTQNAIFDGDNCTLLCANGLSFADEKQLSSKDIALPCTFENEYYVAEISDKGYIVSLTEKTSGENVYENCGMPFGVIKLQADKGDNWVEFAYPWEYDAGSFVANLPDPANRSKLPVHNRIDLAHGGVNTATAKVFGDGDILRITQSGSLRHWKIDMPLETTVTLYKNSPRIDYHTETVCNDRFIRLRVHFPTNIENGKAVFQIPYGTVERNKATQVSEMFTDFCNDKAGIALINRGIPSNNAEDGILSLTLLRSVAMEYKCDSQGSYNLGKHYAFDYSVMPHSNGIEKVWQKALEFNNPMIETEKCELQDIKIEKAQISALRFDGDEVFLRLYNPLEDSVIATVTLPDQYTAYCYADGCMNAVSDKFSVSGSINIELGAFKVANIRIYK